MFHFSLSFSTYNYKAINPTNNTSQRNPIQNQPNTYFHNKQKWGFRKNKERERERERPTRPHWANLREPARNHSRNTIRLLFLVASFNLHGHRWDPILFLFFSWPLHVNISRPHNTLFSHLSIFLSLSI